MPWLDAGLMVQSNTDAGYLGVSLPGVFSDQLLSMCSTWSGQGSEPCQIPLTPWASHTIKSKSHVECEERMKEHCSPEEAWIVSTGFSCVGEYGVMHYIPLPSTYSPPLSWSLKDIAYKRDDSRRRPSSVVLLHLGATAACLWRDKVVPFSFCILRPIF